MRSGDLRRRIPRRTRDRQSGYGYLLVLAMLAVLAWQAARATELWRIEHRREQEMEMEFAGGQILRAIKRYFEHGPQPGCYPESLNVLVDTRDAFGAPLLRKPFADPLVQDGIWGRIDDADGRLRGVHSLAQGSPIASSPLRRGHDFPADAISYATWRFVHHPGSQAVLPPQACRR